MAPGVRKTKENPRKIENFRLKNRNPGFWRVSWAAGVVYSIVIFPGAESVRVAFFGRGSIFIYPGWKTA